MATGIAVVADKPTTPAARPAANPIARESATVGGQQPIGKPPEPAAAPATLADWLRGFEQEPAPAIVRDPDAERAPTGLPGAPAAKPGIAPAAPAPARRSIVEPATAGSPPASTAASPARVARASNDSVPGAASREAATLDDFRFDFGATPLETTVAAASRPVASPSMDLPTAPRPSRPVADASQSTPPANQPRISATPVVTRPQGQRGWTSSLSAAAGLLAILAPAAYMVLTWSDEPATVAEQSFEFEGTPPGEAPKGERPASDRAAFIAERSAADAATPPSLVQPAGFERDAPAGRTPNPPTVDRYAAPAAEKRDGAAAAADRYATDDRYKNPATSPAPATAAQSEPAEFAPADRVTRLDSGAPAANRIAAFESPEAPAAIVADDRTTPEQRPSEDASSLIGAPVYGESELAEAIAGAEPAARGFVSGDLADAAQAPQMGQHYARLCYLAQVLTFYEPTDGAPTNLPLEAAEVLKRSMRTQAARDSATQVAVPWIAWTGKPHGGVMFAGTPTVATPAGSVYEYRFPIGEEEVIVVSPEPFDVDRFVAVNSKSVGVIGVLVEAPRERIAGYTGDAERVVWARKTLTLREPSL
jgi:hypothetical protein